MNVLSLNEVLARPDLWRGGHFADAALPAVSSGFAELDAQLPDAGWPRGALTELLCDGCGQGEMSLLVPGLQQLCADDGWLLVIAPPYPLQAAAWAAAGIALHRLIVVMPPTGTAFNRRQDVDALWAAQQGLISDAPAAIVCWSATSDARAVHRLQVAAVSSHAATFLLRPLRTASTASAAPLRLTLASGDQGRLNVHILKRRGLPLAHPLHLALSRPASWHTHASLVARPTLSPASSRRAPASAGALFG